MLSSVIKKETREFAEYFFGEVIDRLRLEDAPDKDYALPRIVFTSCRSESEQRRYSELRKMLATVFDSLPKRQITEHSSAYMQNSIREHMGADFLEEYSALESKLPKRANGKHLTLDNVVLLNEAAYMAGVNYGVTGHELVHAIRSQIVDVMELSRAYDEFGARFPHPFEILYPDQVEVVPAVVAEFIAGLEKVIFRDILGGNEKYEHLSNEGVQTHPALYDLEVVHSFFKNDFASVAVTLIDLYTKLISAQGKILRTNPPKDSPLRKEAISLLHRYIDYAQCFSSPNSDAVGYYLLLVSCMCLKSVKEFQEDVRLRMYHNVDFGDIRNVFEHSDPLQLEKDLRSFRTTISSILKFPSLEILDPKLPYHISGVALSTVEDSLLTEWPKVLLMPAKEVEQKYILPIEIAIERMKRLGCVARRRKTRAEKTLNTDTWI